jgi:hypothetical protein
MQPFEIQPLFAPALSQAAQFLHRWRANEADGKPDPLRTGETAAGIETRLRWLLVANPAAREDQPLGYCVCDAEGTIRGLNLCYPGAFLWGDQRLFGLGAGSFFVETPARSLGFFLFKKFLNVPGYTFYFATTCNPLSALLWNKLGGAAVPSSAADYILPLRLDRMFPAFIAKKTSNRAAAMLAGLGGRCANPLLRLLIRPAPELTVEPCADWEKLAALARWHRPAQFVTSDRSPEFLQWRYGAASPLQPCRIYLFRDRQGNEGWFSLGDLMRGRQVQLRGSVLLDVIWPREKMSFRGILQAIVGQATPGADGIVLRAQPEFDYREFSRWVIPYKLPAPRAFVKTRAGAPAPEPEAIDLEDGDYGAWARHWGNDTAALKGEESVLEACVR